MTDNNGKKIFGVLLLMGILALIFNLITGTNTRSAPRTPQKNLFDLFVNQKESLPPLPSGSYIATIKIEGQIMKDGYPYDHKWIMDAIATLKDDPNNKGLLLFLDSPGGTIYESDEVYLLLKKYKEAEKPLWSYCGGMTASGAYYIAAASDKIYANRNSLVGSIGVIFGGSVDATGLLEKLGIKVENIHSGANKLMGSLTEPFTDEQREIEQSICDEAYEQFVGIVADSRSMEAGEAHAIADGRIYSAAQALHIGLIDGIEDAFDDVYDLMVSTEFTPNNKHVRRFDMKKPERNSLYDLVMNPQTLSNLKSLLATGRISVGNALMSLYTR